MSFQTLLFRKALVSIHLSEGFFLSQEVINQKHHLLIYPQLLKKKTFNDPLNALQAIQTEINGLSLLILRNRKVLDVLTAQQRDQCAIIGEKCFYVDKSFVTIVIQNLKDLKDQKKIFHQISDLSSIDLVQFVQPWLLVISALGNFLILGKCFPYRHHMNLSFVYPGEF